MADEPNIRVEAGGFGSENTRVLLNGKEIPGVRKFMIYQRSDELFPTVILELESSVVIEAKTPVLYLEREKQDGVQSTAGSSVGQGGSVAEDKK